MYFHRVASFPRTSIRIAAVHKLCSPFNESKLEFAYSRKSALLNERYDNWRAIFSELSFYDIEKICGCGVEKTSSWVQEKRSNKKHHATYSQFFIKTNDPILYAWWHARLSQFVHISK